MGWKQLLDRSEAAGLKPHQQSRAVVTTHSSSVLKTMGTSSKTTSIEISPDRLEPLVAEGSEPPTTEDNPNLTKALTNMKRKHKTNHRLCLDRALICSDDLF